MYAASQWGHHARNNSKCLDKIMDFLEHDDKVHLSGFALMASTKVPLEMPRMRANSTTGRVRALHLVAFFRLEEVFGALGQSRVLRFPTRKFKKQLS